MADRLIEKLTSRKFWFAVAAMLGSIGTGVTGLVIGDYDLTKIGALLLVASGGIYSFCEALVDGKRASATITTTSLSANTNDKAIVAKALNGETNEPKE